MSDESDDSPLKNEQDDDADSVEEEHQEKSHVPLALGLQRVGTAPPPKPNPTQPVQVLNARGMPARIRKRNKLFFDDDIVNDSKSFKTSTSPRKSSKPSSPAKSPMKLLKKRKVTPTKFVKVKMEEKPQEEVVKQETTTKSGVVMVPFDKKVGQQIGLRLRNLLKLPKAHKWVSFDFFYSFIDKAIFHGENDFQTCLNATFPQLKARKLTRPQWSKIRSMIGKPRRCSEAFFRAERRELERRRQKIRLLQTRKSINPEFVKELPPEIPLQLPVATKVTARLRDPQDGVFIGTVDAVDSLTSTYRVTFDRPGLGTHSIPDYEVLANDFNETIPIAYLTQDFRPKLGLNGPYLYSPARAKHFLNKSDPLLGQELSDNQFRSIVLQHETIGGYPIKLLEAIVRLKKTLSIKSAKLQKLKAMNHEAEIYKSYGDSFPEEFQRRYAGIVVATEKINREIHDYLNQMQTYSSELTKEPHLAAMLTPSYLREKCRELAIESVERNNANLIQDSHVLGLITDLATLMLVASHFASGENTHVLKILEGCVEEVKNRLDAVNVEIFQKNVQIHMHHIRLGLSQVANNNTNS